jgi:hypothetical protein
MFVDERKPGRCPARRKQKKCLLGANCRGRGLRGVSMAIRCENCTHQNQPDSNGRMRPWCSFCGAGLGDVDQRLQTRPEPVRAAAPAGPDFHGAGVAAGPQFRRSIRKKDSPWLILSIGLGSIGLGIAVVVSTVGDAVSGWSSRNWPKTRGTVVRAWVQEWESDRGGRSYSLSATYKFEVNGKRYEGDRVRFSNQLQAGDFRRGEEELAKIATTGKPCDVYYDPSDPTRSCLVPGASLFYLIFLPLLAGLFLLVGVTCTLGSIRQILSAGKSTLTAAMPA